MQHKTNSKKKARLQIWSPRWPILHICVGNYNHFVQTLKKKCHTIQPIRSSQKHSNWNREICKKHKSQYSSEHNSRYKTLFPDVSYIDCEHLSNQNKILSRNWLYFVSCQPFENKTKKSSDWAAGGTKISESLVYAAQNQLQKKAGMQIWSPKRPNLHTCVEIYNQFVQTLKKKLELFNLYVFLRNTIIEIEKSESCHIPIL